MLRTDRLELRPFAVEDAGELLTVFRDPAVRRYLLDDALVDAGWVEEEIRSSRASFRSEGWGLWAVRLISEAPIAGFAGYRHFFEPPELQLIYGLTPDYWGRGFATEAARAVVELGFEELGFESVVAATDVPNAASVRVIERLGMTLDRRTEEGEYGTVYYRLERPARSTEGIE